MNLRPATTSKPGVNLSGASTLVVHQAALGDFILIWPLLRALSPCVVAAPGERARLAERLLPGVRGVEIETAFFNALWRGGGADERFPAIGRVVSFVADDDSVWARGARAAFPNATIEFRQTRPPLRLEDPALHPPVRRVAEGPVVFHVGAGSRAKRWSVEESVERAGEMAALVAHPQEWAGFGSGGGAVRLIAGAVERERFEEAERRVFAEAGGEYVESLEALAAVIAGAHGYVGFDTGPTHLAAQMGVPTAALFRCTDPRVWGPIGPAVRVVEVG